MKKYICIILIALLVCTILTACELEVGSAVDKFERFEVVKILSDSTNRYSVYIIVDTQTNVEYLFMDRDYRAAITVLLNSDGTPMLWYGE